jgi:phage tail protein X
MPITAISTDTTVEKLVTRMFGKLPAAKLRAATEATLAANPHLADASNVPAGTVVVVPTLDVADPPSVREEARISDDQVKAIAGAIAGYQQEIVERLAQRASTLGDAAKLLGSAQFKRDLEGVEDAAPLLPDLAAALKTERRELTERRDLLAKDVSSLTDALAALGRQLE